MLGLTEQLVHLFDFQAHQLARNHGVDIQLLVSGPLTRLVQ